MIQIHQADFVIWIWHFGDIKKQDTESSNTGFNPTVAIMGMH